ncbi:MAG: nucleotide exchange factor GrpE [Rhodobacteraceae bacterium]|nr:nucleotide exchange factor GrpE [Paracoccaceae bacterium]
MSDKQQPKKSKTEELLSLDELIAESEEGEESLGAEYEPDEQEGPNLEKIIEERDILQDKLMRTLADSENLRKRSIRDRSDAEVYGGTKLARDLLSVYDNITRALDAVSDEQRKSNAGLIEGIELTQKELINGFEKHKIIRIMPEEGDVFDPLIHQAMFEAPLPESKAGEIIQVMAVGFKIGDRLLRPAQVGVSSNPG